MNSCIIVFFSPLCTLCAMKLLKYQQSEINIMLNKTIKYALRVADTPET